MLRMPGSVYGRTHKASINVGKHQLRAGPGLLQSLGVRHIGNHKDEQDERNEQNKQNERDEQEDPLLSVPSVLLSP